MKTYALSILDAVFIIIKNIEKDWLKFNAMHKNIFYIQLKVTAHNLHIVKGPHVH